MSKLENLEIYKLSMTVSDLIWNEVLNWDNFSKFTIGSQLVKSADSVSANIAEGFGRNSAKEYRMFCYYSRGSLKETICFIQKAHSRKLISSSVIENIISLLKTLAKRLNGFINYLNSNIYK